MSRGVKPGLVEDEHAVGSVPAAPDWLSDYAKAEWNRVAPILVERLILTDADLGSLANYCCAIGQVQMAEREIAKHGILLSTARGTRQNPAVAVQANAMTRARLLAGELGLTPVSRGRPAVKDNGSAGTLFDL